MSDKPRKKSRSPRTPTRGCSSSRWPPNSPACTRRRCATTTGSDWSPRTAPPVADAGTRRGTWRCCVKCSACPRTRGQPRGHQAHHRVDQSGGGAAEPRRRDGRRDRARPRELPPRTRTHSAQQRPRRLEAAQPALISGLHGNPRHTFRPEACRGFPFGFSHRAPASRRTRVTCAISVARRGSTAVPSPGSPATPLPRARSSGSTSRLRCSGSKW